MGEQRGNSYNWGDGFPVCTFGRESKVVYVSGQQIEYDGRPLFGVGAGKDLIQSVLGETGKRSKNKGIMNLYYPGWKLEIESAGSLRPMTSQYRLGS